MTDKKNAPVVLRFLLDLQAEDPTYIDVQFESVKQAKRAINDVYAANGAMVLLTTAGEIPVLLSSADVAAAYVVDEDDEDDD